MRRILAAALLVTLGAGVAPAQQVDRFARVSHVIVPQRRAFHLRPQSRKAMHPIRIDKVRARVKILEQAATTELEVSLSNPGGRLADGQRR